MAADPLASDEVKSFARDAVASGDSGARPFAIVDKKNARLYVYAADGRLRAASPVLLGLARGDDSVPGIGERPISSIRPGERTTPAGRFIAEPGRNLAGEDIIWVDYDAAVSMHRVRANNKAERRLERLASTTASDNRISYGCINVPAAFYDTHVKPLIGGQPRADLRAAGDRAGARPIRVCDGPPATERVRPGRVRVGSGWVRHVAPPRRLVYGRHGSTRNAVGYRHLFPGARRPGAVDCARGATMRALLTHRRWLVLVAVYIALLVGGWLVGRPPGRHHGDPVRPSNEVGCMP